MKTYEVAVMWGTREVYRVEAENEAEAAIKWTDYSSEIVKTEDSAEEVLSVVEVQ